MLLIVSVFLCSLVELLPSSNTLEYVLCLVLLLYSVSEFEMFVFYMCCQLALKIFEKLNTCETSVNCILVRNAYRLVAALVKLSLLTGATSNYLVQNEPLESELRNLASKN